ncbi:uncharacterized protein LOC110032228 [Phalaenopsis equestris]|uniref:uncharacterized protein LOC110032228 n=1 Tax=Phalaenopsis equestris TaxID=78828 RepID=UPI0009E6189E|nr:uncharacterized protein LOC110032228 [Phalaenopsis equestris]
MEKKDAGKDRNSGIRIPLHVQLINNPSSHSPISHSKLPLQPTRTKYGKGSLPFVKKSKSQTSTLLFCHAKTSNPPFLARRFHCHAKTRRPNASPGDRRPVSSPFGLPRRPALSICSEQDLPYRRLQAVSNIIHVHLLPNRTCSLIWDSAKWVRCMEELKLSKTSTLLLHTDRTRRPPMWTVGSFTSSIQLYKLIPKICQFR